MWNPFKKKQKIIFIEPAHHFSPFIKVSSNSPDFYDDVKTLDMVWTLLKNFPNITFQEKIGLLNLFLNDKYKIEQK